MAYAPSKKKTDKAEDSVSWKVSYTVPVDDTNTYTSFSTANTAATTYTRETGLPASAVRA